MAAWGIPTCAREIPPRQAIEEPHITNAGDQLRAAYRGRGRTPAAGSAPLERSVEPCWQYAEDLKTASGGFARYQIVDQIEVDEWPAKVDGFRYDDRSFLHAWRHRSGFHEPDGVDYGTLLRRFNIVGRVDAGDIDEVWIFAPPYTGLWGSTMAGPGAFWCNSAPIAGTGRCARRL